MDKIGKVTNTKGDLVGYLVKSPATGEHVCFYTKGEHAWYFNGNVNNPTFRPSMLVNPDKLHARDHFFVTEGKIQYLSDCDHDMAGKTVDMVDLDD